MYCENCGVKNPDDAVLCQSCGTQVAGEGTEPSNQVEDSQTLINEESEKRKNQFIGGGVVLLAFLVSIMIITSYLNGQVDTAFKEKLEVANHYLEQMDYEKAEASFLEAIKVNPKAEEPYLELSQLYAKQGKTEKAEKILETGEKKTGSKKIKENLQEIKNQQVAAKKAEKADITKADLADTGTFPDDESNGLGIISSFDIDVDGDGNKETLTTASQSHRQMKMLITLTKQDGSNTVLDQIKPEETVDDTESYEDSRSSVFVKKKGDRYYLVADNYEAAQSGSWYRTYTVYELGSKPSKKCEIKTQWDKGQSAITVDGKTVYKDENEAGDKKKQTKEALDLLKETLKPYDMEKKAHFEENEDGTIAIGGFDKSDKSEINISKTERVQTADSSDGKSEMEVVVEDYTELRERMEERETTDDGDTLDSSGEEIDHQNTYRSETEAGSGVAPEEQQGSYQEDYEGQYENYEDDGDYEDDGGYDDYEEQYEDYSDNEIYYDEESGIPYEQGQ